MTTLQNFDSVAQELIASATSEKAYQFACKVANQVAEKGEDWMKANEGRLCIRINAAEQTEAPVRDNRVFILSQWQAALIGL